MRAFAVLTAALLIGITVLDGCAPRAALTQNDLDNVSAAPRPGAKAPLNLLFTDQRGGALTLGQAISNKPAVLIFADYTCRYLCGPALVLTAAALDKSPLRADRDYSFVVVGINPRDGPVQARAMQAAELRSSGAGGAARLLSNGPSPVAAAALGYRYLYDARLGQYAHDTSIYILGADGSVRRVLPEFALTPAALTGALEQARTPPTMAPPLSAPLRFICYCLQPLTGAYDQPAIVALRLGGVATLGVLGFGVVLALRRRRERRP
jgi:protein SCO1/2